VSEGKKWVKWIGFFLVSQRVFWVGSIRWWRHTIWWWINNKTVGKKRINQDKEFFLGVVAFYIWFSHVIVFLKVTVN